ncbi:hypothetical protein HYPSUDRAFT_291004 [Hypholoma sublateritium FD-334 SS-4]|uniref:Nephrocystin 3-like N-terminal domain-containing protein n=1 Tax=Hypholoma sublateritium (strain FD-334 SS-4) TaxID=945553 RepID=A0A0D2P814_HYPSF|nr:hypothetical protein HYPSUDRAFT_291004 [Hypholoma sublateritium FD-334 SS-4]
MLDNLNSVTINGGVFTQHNSTMASSLSVEAFARLQQAVVPGAFHNSGERFDPPKCHPRTRLAVTERIRNWILGKESTNSFIMWLNGSAGAGKSAIAQRIAELCHEDELLASIFFSKSDPRRNHLNFLFPTIAYQIACAIPAARSGIEQEIIRDPLIFTRNLEAQMIALVVKPLQPLVDSGYFSDPASSPRLIIIDGLDEVVDRQAQTKILEAVSNILRCHRLPLIFLIASRPEQEIMYAFSTQPLAQLSVRLPLDHNFHPDDDIRIFLDDSFSEIKAEHPRRNLIPSSWPTAAVMGSLVYKASGQFIYAATIIRFIKSLRHRPVDRLEIILGIRPVLRDMPFGELDALYMHILSALEDPDRTLLIIGVILAQGPGGAISKISNIEKFLGLDAGDGEFLLADMTSLLSLENGTVCMLHASFGDFLFDPARSGTFSVDRTAVHTTMAYHCIRRLNGASRDDSLAEGNTAH